MDFEQPDHDPEAIGEVRWRDGDDVNVAQTAVRTGERLGDPVPMTVTLVTMGGSSAKPDERPSDAGR